MSVRIVVLAALVAIGCEPLADPIEPDRVEVPVFERENKIAPNPSPTRLKVMTWNIKYGACRIDFWFDGWGDRVQMSWGEVRGNLDKIESLIREVDPDILFTNEIEVNSRRSAYFDMVQDILDHTSLNYGAYFQAWNSRYIASEGVGRIDMGVGVFSKYPITFAERIRQPDQGELDFLHKIFYLHTVIGRTRIHVGNRDLAAYVAHVSAYDTDGTKQRQLKQLHDIVSAETLPMVFGGDFNEIPPTSVKIKDFNDEHPSLKGTEFEQPPYTPWVMQPFYDKFKPLIALDRYGKTEAEQSKFYSHSIKGPNNGGFWTRQLDYLWLNQGDWENTDILQSPGRLGITADPNTLSDHAPAAGTWVLP